MPLHSDKITAILGPTNTGKTYLAIERMLGHQTGMIGFPLRLLARENYDRVVALVGRDKTALVTGEEKIIPPKAKYFLCTVESMPVAKLVEFLAVDEIQLCADAERGHLFTDRLLHARGQAETMFLGSESVKSILRQLVPNAEFITRPRFSKLTYVGAQKLSRIKRRSAIVAFSANDVYALAEHIRRISGGAAVVLGALSPRTRNAQVQMYQEGDVDFLIATDAIGMGLNMNIDHVAFWRLHKFDGMRKRPLAVDEVAQIAGRAGRFMQEGTFGTFIEAGSFDAEIIEAVENHRFQKKKSIWWRNSNLSFRSLKSLLKSLDEAPPDPVLRRVREPEDQVMLRYLSLDRSVSDLATNTDMVELLWEVCQIPDFRETLADVHLHLLRTIFKHLARAEGQLPEDWVADQLERLKRVDGDIDTLVARIAHTRTWTYISHRTNWIKDAVNWQLQARQLEDLLSDALHERLTERFVDRRSNTMLRSRGKHLEANVSAENEVFVEGMFIGYLNGLSFTGDLLASTGDRRLLSAAANRGLHREILNRVSKIEEEMDSQFSLSDDGTIQWREQNLGKLKRGKSILEPQPQVQTSEILSAPLRDRVVKRLLTWFHALIKRRFTPLFIIQTLKLSGPARGLVFQLRENLGSIPRSDVRKQIDGLTKADRKILREFNVKLGYKTIFFPSLIKPKIITLRALMWAIWNDLPPPAVPPPGTITLKAKRKYNRNFLESIGYSILGPRFVRIDILDRIAVDLIKAKKSKELPPIKEISSILGLSIEDTEIIITKLGDTLEFGGPGENKFIGNRRRLKSVRPTKGNENDLPFSKLKEYKF